MKTIEDMINHTPHLTRFSCPICGSNSTFVFCSQHSRKVYECQYTGCGHFFTPPVHDDQGICPRDSNIEKESDKALLVFDERNNRLLQLFISKIRTNRRPLRFLDYGAGNAHVSRTFKRIMKDQCAIHCYEPNPLCKGLYEKYGLAQVVDAGSANEKMDLVYMIEVIEHLENPIAALRVLRSLLLNDGVLFLSTPLGTRVEHSTNAYDTISHLHFFTEKSLNRALAAAGFSTIEVHYYPELYPLRTGRARMSFWLEIIRAGARKLFSPRSRQQRNKHSHLTGFARPISMP